MGRTVTKRKKRPTRPRRRMKRKTVRKIAEEDMDEMFYMYSSDDLPEIESDLYDHDVKPEINRDYYL